MFSRTIMCPTRRGKPGEGLGDRGRALFLRRHGIKREAAIRVLDEDVLSAHVDRSSVDLLAVHVADTEVSNLLAGHISELTSPFRYLAPQVLGGPLVVSKHLQRSSTRGDALVVVLPVNERKRHRALPQEVALRGHTQNVVVPSHLHLFPVHHSPPKCGPGHPEGYPGPNGPRSEERRVGK